MILERNKIEKFASTLFLEHEKTGSNVPFLFFLRLGIATDGVPASIRCVMGAFE